MPRAGSLAAVFLVGAMVLALFAVTWPGVLTTTNTIEQVDSWDNSDNDVVNRNQRLTITFIQNIPLIVLGGLAMTAIIASREVR